MSTHQTVYPKPHPRSMFDGNSEASPAYTYTDHPRSNAGLPSMRAPRTPHELVHHGGVKAKRTPKRFAPMHSGLPGSDIDIMAAAAAAVVPRPSYDPTDGQLNVRKPHDAPQSSNRHWAPPATTTTTNTVNMQRAAAGKPSDANAPPRTHTLAFASMSRRQPQAKATESVLYIDLTEPSDCEADVPSSAQRETPSRCETHETVANDSHTPPASVSVANIGTDNIGTDNNGTNHRYESSSSNSGTSPLVARYPHTEKPGNGRKHGIAAADKESSTLVNMGTCDPLTQEESTSSQRKVPPLPAVIHSIETPANGLHPMQSVRAVTPKHTQEAAVPSSGVEKRRSTHIMEDFVRVGKSVEEEVRPSIEKVSTKTVTELRRVQKNAVEKAKAPERIETEAKLQKDRVREASHAFDPARIVDLMTEYDLISHRSALLDAHIYSQEGARTPPLGVSLAHRDTRLPKAVYSPVYLHANPRIHGMHHRSEAWSQQKAEEIHQRGQRKRWFGNPIRRKKWLQILKAEADFKEVQKHKSFPFPPRKEPEPWAHQTPVDFASMREEDLPSDVRENPVWLRICARLRADKAMRHNVPYHQRRAGAMGADEADALVKARQQAKEAARRQAQSELFRQVEEVRKLASPRSKTATASKAP